MNKKEFGSINGRTVYLYTIANANGMKAEILDYGAILRSLYVPGKNGEPVDVCLGFETAEEYTVNGPFMGATVGPCANRTAGAAYEIDGVSYKMAVNDGPNNLHSDIQKGYHKTFFEVDAKDDSITLSLTDPDGSMGFPGTKEFAVTYTVTADNALQLDYKVTTDKKTIINPTNHSYFNLSGHGAGSIENHLLTIKAQRYTPVIQGSIPTGELAPVAGTPMDFTAPKEIGKEIRADFEQLHFTGGYDHNWVLDDYDGSLHTIAVLSDPASGRKMEVATTLPGVQFYAGNFIGEQKAKGGLMYHNRSGLALETQFFPDTIHEPSFPSYLFDAQHPYQSTTVYRFFQD
ncbi:MAG: galactose mutarotase [Lachnospiraceae bacterium]|nr:galactose mutarotase [Lachnospiraceae bacterium]